MWREIKSSPREAKAGVGIPILTEMLTGRDAWPPASSTNSLPTRDGERDRTLTKRGLPQGLPTATWSRFLLAHPGHGSLAFVLLLLSVISVPVELLSLLLIMVKVRLDPDVVCLEKGLLYGRQQLLRKQK